MLLLFEEAAVVLQCSHLDCLLVEAVEAVKRRTSQQGSLRDANGYTPAT